MCSKNFAFYTYNIPNVKFFDTLICIFSNIVFTYIYLYIFCWFISYQLGADATVQFLVVVLVGFMNTSGIYYIVRRMNHERHPYKVLKRVAELSHVETGPFYKGMRRLMDRM